VDESHPSREEKLEPIIVLIHHQQTLERNPPTNQPTNQLQVHARGFEPKMEKVDKATRMPKNDQPCKDQENGREPWDKFILGITKSNAPSHPIQSM
jgi:hypothetical protein